MKNLIAFVLFIAVSTAAYSTGNTEDKKAERAEKVKLIETQQDVYKLIYPFKGTSDVTISFLDEKGKTLNVDKVKNEKGFMKSYDLSNLSTGDYTVKIEDEESSIEKPLAINHKGNLTVTSDAKDIYKLHVDFPGRSDLYLNIYNRNGELVHHEKHENTNGFDALYNLSKINSDTYTFEVRGYSEIEKVTVSK